MIILPMTFSLVGNLATRSTFCVTCDTSVNRDCHAQPQNKSQWSKVTSFNFFFLVELRLCDATCIYLALLYLEASGYCICINVCVTIQCRLETLVITIHGDYQEVHIFLRSQIMAIVHARALKSEHLLSGMSGNTNKLKSCGNVGGKLQIDIRPCYDIDAIFTIIHVLLVHGLNTDLCYQNITSQKTQIRIYPTVERTCTPRKENGANWKPFLSPIWMQNQVL